MHIRNGWPIIAVMSKFEEKMGEHFIASRRDQMLVSRGSRILAGIAVPAAALNYFIAPAERMTYTAGPLLGAAVPLRYSALGEYMRNFTIQYKTT